MYFRKHGTKWYYRMSVTLPDGTRKIVERAGGKTKAEARKKAMLDAKKYMNGIEWLYIPLPRPSGEVVRD